MDQVSAIAQVNDVLTGHPEDARYITGAQQRGLDPLHIHHRPSQTPKTQHDSPNATTSLHIRDLCLLLIGPTVTALLPCVLVTHLVTSAVARSLLHRALLNVQRSWSPTLAELRRRPPGVLYEVRT